MAATYQWTTNPLKCWPAAADGVTLTPSGSAWTNGSYVELEDSAAEDSVLVAVVVRTADSDTRQFEVDIATGAAASETVIATIKGTWSGGSATTDGVNLRWVFNLPVDLISQGDRVSARIRVHNTDVGTFIVSAQYYEKPIVGILDVSDTVPKVVPSAANMLFFEDNAAAWTFGNWTEIIASTSTAIVIDGFSMYYTTNSSQGEFEIGVGAAAAETAIARIKVDAINLGGHTFTPLPIPLDNIPTSTRVSVRSRGTGAGGTDAHLALSYREKPL